MSADSITASAAENPRLSGDDVQFGGEPFAQNEPTAICAGCAALGEGSRSPQVASAIVSPGPARSGEVADCTSRMDCAFVGQPFQADVRLAAGE
jgi:hypothetical protein